MKILIRLPNWLGDVVMSTALVNAVRQLYPGSQIDVIIKKELAGIAQLIPDLNAVHPFSKSEYSGLSGAYRFGKKFRAEKFDLFFNLPSSLSSIVMAWATKAKKRIGFGAEGGSFLLTHSFKRPSNRHRADEYVFLLEQYSGTIIDKKEVILESKKSVTPATAMVLINFNSEAISRRMPLYKAKEILALLTNTFKKTSFIFIGSKKEADFVDQIIAGSKDIDRIQNEAGKTDLVSLSNLMQQSAAILTTDSGPAHLANALGVPTVVLFGAGNENNTAPYNKEYLKVIRSGKLECEPCVRNTCKLYGVPKCMQLLDEKEIINALSSYLNHD
jgi:lipopolysaccharide heptosyltransferase II